MRSGEVADVDIPDRSVHSDFLIHWTGKDIDEKHQPGWHRVDHRLRTNQPAEAAYLERLREILTYGLWMTEEEEAGYRVGSTQITIPCTPKCCFTELKLSESWRHAVLYGRLGIGVKRPFLFERFGRPVAYFGFREDSSKDRFLEECSRDLRDKRLLNFFKPMNRSSRPLTYELYAESEWRILLFEELLEAGKIVDPRDTRNEKEHAYFNTLNPQQQKQLKFLIPLDGWFSMIIYPSLGIKNAARWDSSLGVIDQIARIKCATDHGNRVEGLRSPIRGNWPIEVDLGSCKNF
jgi:hypothetical protein